MAQNPRRDPEYRRYKDWLRTHHVECWFDGCTNRATTPDHVPALMHHTHRRGSRCCQLKPACAPCNSSHGATEGNKLREPHTPW